METTTKQAELINALMLSKVIVTENILDTKAFINKVENEGRVGFRINGRPVDQMTAGQMVLNMVLHPSAYEITEYTPEDQPWSKEIKS